LALQQQQLLRQLLQIHLRQELVLPLLLVLQIHLLQELLVLQHHLNQMRGE
jgi:hypothetical protein